MKFLLLLALAAYAVAAIHAILAFINKRRAADRVAVGSLAAGFAAHTFVIILDWLQDGHYPLYSFRETLSFLAWTLAVAYFVASVRYHINALAVLTMPLVAFLVTEATLTTRRRT
jgi:ABC-type transport system involved in cytochrome c biogenesis permease subunit